MKSLHVIAGACGLLLLNLGACKPKPIITSNTLDDRGGGRKPEDFPELAEDVFEGMDQGAKLGPDEIKGRNTWNLWCAGNEQFWDKVAREGFGLFDLLKTIDSNDREKRLEKYGLINQPGFKKAAKPDQYGLRIDEGTEPAGIDPKVYGRPTGVMGFRLFENPDFKGEAVERWKKEIDPATGLAKRFYEDADFAANRDLVRPYRVGVSCGSCHIAFHPCHPPENPAEPKYENLASAIGNQYIREGATFAPNVRAGGFFHEMTQAQPRGTSDTSRIATDNINNPNAINAIFLLAERERIQVEEELAGGTLALQPPFVKANPQPVAHILKDGADSIGVPGATIRVFVNIGMYHQHWLQQHNALIGLMPQQPFDIATARKNSVYWLATEQKVPNIAAFFRKLEPYRLEDAEEKGEPVGKKYLSPDAEVMKRGALVFAENCATCHSSKQPPAGAKPEEWFAQEVLKPDFRDHNFFSDEKRYPITKIKTNAGRALGTNAMAGHVWDNFSSKTYKSLPSVGMIQVWNPYSEQDEDFAVEGGGPGYYRTPSLISIWSSAPFLHNNSLGEETIDPSVAGRMKAFDDAVQKLLWPEKRKGKEGIWRTSAACQIQLQASRLPERLVRVLRLKGHIEKDTDGTEFFRIGHIPKGTPINLLANINPKADPEALAELCIKLKLTLAEIRLKNLDEAATKELLKAELAPALFKVSKCPDFINDRGHTFGSELPDADKLALIEYLKTI